MRLTVIGCSPAWPNPGGAHSGYLVEAPGCGRLLLDCGPGVLSRLRARDLLPVDAIAITHFHLDHFGDLVPWCWMDQHSAAPRARVLLLVPPGGRQALVQTETIFGRAGMFEKTFDVQEYPVEEPVGVAGFRLRAEAMCHYDVPAYGMAVSDPAGAVLGYSGDTALCPGLEALAADATLLLCEATLPEPEPPGALRGHLSAAEAAGVARGDLLLTHRPAELAPPAGLAVAREGATVEL